MFNANERLTNPERQRLTGLVKDGQITKRHLPEKGLAVGLDSMGPMRNPKTDTLFPGTVDMLGQFSETLDRYRMLLVVATNGPDKEGIEILRALNPEVNAFAITEGGGKLISRRSPGSFDVTILANRDELSNLDKIEQAARQDPLLHAMLSDEPFLDEPDSMRTPYDTNKVITLPSDYQVFAERLRKYGVAIEEELPDVNPNNYVERVLDHTRRHLNHAIADLDLTGKAHIIVKGQNRRIYLTPDTLFDGRFSKYGGVILGSKILNMHEDYRMQPYRMENSIYIADKAVDLKHGEEVLGESERSMITGGVILSGDTRPNSSINIIKMLEVEHGDQILYIATVAARLAMNVTMDQQPPRMDQVQGVPILHIGTGQKALGAISHLMERIHN